VGHEREGNQEVVRWFQVILIKEIIQDTREMKAWR
jgi:hypothetical protein